METACGEFWVVLWFEGWWVSGWVESLVRLGGVCWLATWELLLTTTTDYYYLVASWVVFGWSLGGLTITGLLLLLVDGCVGFVVV